jgi:hypothetical protein
VGGVPKLGDIGLVGEVGESASYVGTEGYIPPEGPGTPQADVFGLGKVLYEASTGMDRLSFPMLPPGTVEDPRQRLLAELNEVFTRACASASDARYQTAEELHADLALLHRGQSVRRQRKTARRWRRASMVGYAAAALAGLAAGVLWSPMRNPSPSPRARPVLATQAPVDLSKFFNVALTNNWFHDFDGNDLSGMPIGWRRLGPANFEVAGLIQLSGAYTESRRLDYPGSVEGIPIGRKCRRLYFLHGTGWPVDKSTLVACYVVHYSNGRKEEIPVRYGEEVRNWWLGMQDTLPVDNASVAWVGTNRIAGGRDKNFKLSLYALVWNNAFADEPISSIDFVSTRSLSCPFLIALTAE